ncbi:hypothetical protein GCM10022386_07950 [Flavobacterium cheonhonense]|uniref:Uncharacterized protein n=1 Tax=Flavobacterium cheonhonense TaxID=706185 RepID=A0ABP7TJ42_9FLAO
MVAVIPMLVLYVLLIYLFCREIKKDFKYYLEQDRLADEHVLREIERFLKEKTTE